MVLDASHPSGETQLCQSPTTKSAFQLKRKPHPDPSGTKNVDPPPLPNLKTAFRCGQYTARLSVEM